MKLYVHVREAKLADAAAIAKVHFYSWQKIYARPISDNLLHNLSIKEREIQWRTWLQNNAEVLVAEAEEENNIYGFISFCPARDKDLNTNNVAEITALYVTPNKWRTGIGKLLIEAALSKISYNNFKEVALWVFEKNSQARSFYEKAGFQITTSYKTDDTSDKDLKEIRYHKYLK